MPISDRSSEVVKLGRLILKFARVERATYHEDGIRAETDTDHTVMLGVIACAFAQAAGIANLHLGQVAIYSLVHDLPEAHAGDTQSFGIGAISRAEKAKREESAIVQIAQDFPLLPWVVDTIRSYERQDTREARYVRYIDKVMPKITHILNGSIALYKLGKTQDEVVLTHANQVRDLAEPYGREFPEVEGLLVDLMYETAETGSFYPVGLEPPAKML